MERYALIRCQRQIFQRLLCAEYPMPCFFASTRVTDGILHAANAHFHLYCYICATPSQYFLRKSLGEFRQPAPADFFSPALHSAFSPLIACAALGFSLLEKRHVRLITPPESYAPYSYTSHAHSMLRTPAAADGSKFRANAQLCVRSVSRTSSTQACRFYARRYHLCFRPRCMLSGRRGDAYFAHNY